MVPAIGLSLASAPDVAHYLPFLQPILSANPILAGLATIFAPAVAATFFVVIGLSIINCALSSLNPLILDSECSERGRHHPWLHLNFWEPTFRVQDHFLCPYHCCDTMACRHWRGLILYAIPQHRQWFSKICCIWFCIYGRAFSCYTFQYCYYCPSMSSFATFPTMASGACGKTSYNASPTLSRYGFQMHESRQI